VESCPKQLLIFSHKLRLRLRLIRSFQSGFEIEAVAEVPQLLQRLRKKQFDIILLCCRSQKEAVEYCKKIRTDIRTIPKLGLIDPDGMITDPDSFIAFHQVDGYLGGYVSVEIIQNYVYNLLTQSENQKTVVVKERRLSLLEKVMQRVRS
jgi:DNA-binding response OmpR family regulator